MHLRLRDSGGRHERLVAMARVAPARWAVEVAGVGVGWQYRYVVAGRDALDPWALGMVGGESWGCGPRDWWSLVVDPTPLPAVVRPTVDPSQRVVYEVHLRGFTQHPSSGVGEPGTYRGLIERLDQLVDLGVTTLELMPLCEWDETTTAVRDPTTGARRLNYWGYQPISWFAPKAAFASTAEPGAALAQLRELVAACHQRGLEVVVDMVLNHTGEHQDHPEVASLSVLAPEAAFLLAPGAKGQDFTGCGNTTNPSHPLMVRLVLDALRWWVEGIGVDGFRLDLAAVLARGEDGAIRANPVLLQAIADDAVLGERLFLAEPWDAAGGYLLGGFAKIAGWLEWNGMFRDDVRRFVRGDVAATAAVAVRLAGSADRFGRARFGPLHSVNFLTCHDGFTLADLVAYNLKHNEANGEDNRDGSNWNHSSNAGVEGPTDDALVLRVRRRRVRAALVLLAAARGTPMLLAGDEIGRSQGGNNNAWCRDDEVGWVDWAQPDHSLRHFIRCLLAWRRARPQLRQPVFSSELPITFRGSRLSETGGLTKVPVLSASWPAHGASPALHIGWNMTARARRFELPAAPAGQCWVRVFDGAAIAPRDARWPDGDPVCDPFVRIEGFSVSVLECREAPPAQDPTQRPARRR